MVNIFNKSKILIKSSLQKLKLITPENQKPIFFSKTWDRYYNLSVMMSLALKKIDKKRKEDLYIAEAGIGIGTTFLLLAFIAKKIGVKLIGFDSFSGFPEITNKKDKRAFGRIVKKGQLNYSSVNSLKNKLTNAGLDEDFINNNIEIVEGFFNNTLKDFSRDKKIFFLHLDVDLYSSYKTCLENLWDSVIDGGVVIFDEYHDKKWPDAKDAIDDFFKEKGKEVKLEELTNRGFIIK